MKKLLALALFATVATAQDVLKPVVSQPLTYSPLITSAVTGDMSGQYMYDSAPVLEQLRSMSGDVNQNFGQLGAFRSSAIMDTEASTYNAALFGGPKPIPQHFVQPMLERATASKSAKIEAPIASAFPAAKSAKPIKEFKFVNAPITSMFETLPVKELPNIVQHYAVPSTFTLQENIKQPITQPVWQPYLQRYEQRAVPVVQPVVNRVTQPVIHRQLHPYLQSETIQGPQQQAIVNAAKIVEFKNEPIVGSELEPLAMDDRSTKPNMPIVTPLSKTHSEPAPIKNK